MKNYYEILGVSRENFDEKGLKKIYRELAKKYHPDRFANSSVDEQNKAKNRFAEINEAYETLSDSKLRDEYNKKLDGESNRRNREYNSSSKGKESYSYNGNIFDKGNINEMFSNFFSKKMGEESSDGSLKKATNERFENFFGFKRRK